MAVVTNLLTDRRMTLQEFLSYEDGSDRRYELVDGVLVEMDAESRVNTQIAILLIEVFLKLVGSKQLGIKEKIQVGSDFATARDADLIIHSKESAAALQGRSEACLLWGEPNPLVVIEVVSPGTVSSENYQRDYVQKPGEYADRGIPEFWQIDPSREWIKVGFLISGIYEFTTFHMMDRIISPTFPDLNLLAAQFLGTDDV